MKTPISHLTPLLSLILVATFTHSGIADPKATSGDYAYSKKNPVKLGAKNLLHAPAAERAYLNLLRDASGKPVKYQRLGNAGLASDGHIIDLYEITTSSRKKLRIYLDMYHPKNSPEKQPAPKGFTKATR